MKKLITAVALMMGVFLLGGVATASAADTTEVVTAADLAGGDWYTADTRPPGTGTFENGPATPPLGTGSFELSTPDGTAKVQLFTDRYDGTRLADIDGIGYSTYNETGVDRVHRRWRRAQPAGGPDRRRPARRLHGLRALPGPGQRGRADGRLAGLGRLPRWQPPSGGSTPGRRLRPGHSVHLVDHRGPPSPTPRSRKGTNCGPGGVKAPCPGSLGVNQGSGNAGASSPTPTRSTCRSAETRRRSTSSAICRCRPARTSARRTAGRTTARPSRTRVTASASWPPTGRTSPRADPHAYPAATEAPLRRGLRAFMRPRRRPGARR